MTHKEDTRTLAQLAQEALDVQNACNLSGVVCSWGRTAGRLHDYTRGTDECNRHPVNVLFASKVAELTGCLILGDSFSVAYTECKRLASARQEEAPFLARVLKDAVEGAKALDEEGGA